MDIRFVSLRFKNILSYGNKETEISFPSGLNAATGTNGTGKSSLLLDTISFCLFGKPHRNVKIKSLINRKNKKGLEVSCDLVVNGNIKYTISRGLSPDFLNITKNDSELDLLSSKKLNQEEIDRILGLDYNLFKQIISLSINQNQPFLSLPAQEKRDIVEQIFNIKIFGMMLKNIKKEKSDSKIKYEIVDRVFDVNMENYKSNKKKLTDMIKIVNNFESQKKKEIQELNSEFNTLDKELDSFILELESINLLDIQDVSTIKQSIEDLVVSKGQTEYELKIKKSEKSTLDSIGDVCHVCKNEISSEYKSIKLSDCDKSIESLESEYKNINLKVKNLKKELTEIEESNAKINTEWMRVDNINNKISRNKKDIESLVKKIENVSNKNIDIDLESFKSDVENKYKELKIQKNERDDIKKSLEMSDAIIEILSENGIKSYIFKKIMPILNNSINNYINVFGLNAVIKFDEFMNDTIKVVGCSDDVSYYSFSEGEKKRIDLAILFSFINITKSLANWNCNILIIDELLDSSVDDSGLEKLLKSLQHISNDSKNQSIYIISHRIQNEFDSMFNTILEIEKNSNGFSTVKTIKGVVN